VSKPDTRQVDGRVEWMTLNRIVQSAGRDHADEQCDSTGHREPSRLPLACALAMTIRKMRMASAPNAFECQLWSAGSPKNS